MCTSCISWSTTNSLIMHTAILHHTSLTDNIPPEIWFKIFLEACTDTGLTGRSLACVSRFFRSVSQPVQHQSIALYGMEQILAFASILDNTPAHLCRVRYLFITKTQLHSSHNVDRNDQKIPISNAQTTYDRISALRVILPVIAPTIEILHIDLVGFGHHTIPSPGFSRLRELQSSGCFLERYMVIPGAPAHSDSPVCPALRYWHITAMPCMLTSVQTLAFLPTLAPSLGHLRILPTVLPVTGYIHHLDKLIGVDPPALTSGVSEPILPLPSSIEKVHVKPWALKCVPPTMAGPSLARRLHESLMRMTNNMNERGDARFVLLPPYREYEKIYDIDDWLERVNGAEGSWSLRERVLPVRSLSFSV